MKRLFESLLAGIILFSILITFFRYGHKVVERKSTYIDLKENWQVTFDGINYIIQDIHIRSVLGEKEKQDKIVKFSRSFYLTDSLKNENLALSIGGIPLGHKVYINGHLIGESPFDDFIYNDWNARYTYFIPMEFINLNGENKIDIYMKSSYEYGSSQEIFIGKANDLIKKDKFMNSYFMSIYFSLALINFIVAAYFVNMYRLNKFNKKYLYFSLTLICTAIYYSNYFISSSIFGYLGFQKIIFSALYISVLSFVFFLRKNYGIEQNEFIKYLSIIYLFLIIVMIIFCNDIYKLTIYRKKLEFIVLLAIGYIIYISIYAYRKYIRNKFIYLTVYSISILMIVHDILIDLSIIKKYNAFHYNSYAIMLILFYMAYELSSEQNNIYINSIKDPLTGLYNRRFLDSYISNAYNKKGFYTLFIIDLDNFKKINDKYGHIVGDIVLKNAANIINNRLPENCIAARYGGEEFIVFCEKSKAFSINLAENIRREIERYNWTKEIGDRDIKVTVSIGAVEFDFKDEFVNVLNLADSALYRAKSNGKNRVEWIN
ncbi:GGDEF domain-containing protein [Caloramator sp. ALD01]|uniref:GGDEF domain-containing protein n=1 Tax=Caloramator sp. ALD01 TaxID=1031288 RepID=UPI0003F849DA|nr:GGDEF domain-containing protein [Caloramator sp. ALD01]